jgi:hypothetical protein
VLQPASGEVANVPGTMLAPSACTMPCIGCLVHIIWGCGQAFNTGMHEPYSGRGVETWTEAMAVSYAPGSAHTCNWCVLLINQPLRTRGASSSKTCISERQETLAGDPKQATSAGVCAACR